MREKFINLHKKFPFLNSVISLVLGAVMSYLFSNIVDVWKQHGTLRQKSIACIVFIILIVLASVYYKFFYSEHRKITALEKEREKSEIQRIKNEREMATSLYKQGTKEMENEYLTIKQKAEIYKQISLVTYDNKREL